MERPIETPAGFHLIQLVARTDATAAELSALRPLVRTRLAAERRAQAEAALYAELEKRAHLRVDEAALRALTKTPERTASR